MVTTILNLIYGFLSYLISLFPTGTGFSGGVHAAATNLADYLHILDPLVPISVLLSCVTIIFTVEIALFGFRTLKWLLLHVCR